MTGGALDRLTEGQRACLRLVLTRANSKEIALDLGISPHTVDQRLRTAIRLLGVASRFEAARLLAQAEHGEAYQAVIYQMPAIPAAPPAGSTGAASSDPVLDEAIAAPTMREAQAPYGVLPPLEGRRPQLPFPVAGQTRNTLGTPARLAWIAALAAGGLLAFGILILGLEGLGRILRI